jgi:hypothetical protein
VSRPVAERIDPELGRVRLCGRCQEEWPRDREFWFFKANGNVLGYCKACWSERRRKVTTIKPGFRLVGTRAYVR